MRNQFPVLDLFIRQKRQWISKSSRISLVLPLVLLSCGILLRTTGLLKSSIWYDEAFSLSLVKLPILEMVRLNALDFSPPLWEILLWVVVRFTGFGAFGLRVLSWAASVASLLLIYRWSRTGKGLAPTNLSLAMIALLPGLLWISQDGRVYAIYALLYLLGLEFAMNQRWLGLIAVCGLLLYSHGTGIFYFTGVLVVALLKEPKKWKQVIMAGVVGFASWLPWLPILIGASKNYSWLGFSFSYFLIQLNGALFGPVMSNKMLLVSVVVMMLTILGATFFCLTRGILHKDRSSPVQMSAIAVWVPLIGMLTTSILIKPILFYRPLAPLVMPICIFSGTIEFEKRIPKVSALLAAFWIVLLFYGLLVWSPETRGGNFEQIAELINQSYRPGDVVYHATGTSWLPFKEYLEPEIHQEILDIPQPTALMNPKIGYALGATYSSLPENQAAWIIFAKDPILTPEGQERMFQLVEDAHLVAVVRGWQFAPIEIWYRSSP